MTVAFESKPRTREDARPIALLGGPKSAQASALVDYILADHILPARLASLPQGKRTVPRPSSHTRMHKAVGALLADLLDLNAEARPDIQPRAGMHGTSPKDFSSGALGFGRSIFMEVVDQMSALGLLKVTRGTPRWLKAFDAFVVRGGTLTTYRLTPKALALVEARGVNLADLATHWRLKDDRPAPTKSSGPLVTLRATRKRVGRRKEDARSLPVDHKDPRVEEIVRDLKALNEFLAKQDIGNIAFLGLRRVFNDGDQEPYGWNKGGRYFSLPGGHFYELRSPEWRRSTITINSEAVGEVDLRASHLTLLHALLKKPFDSDRDPYELPDFPRAAVKAWVSQAMGSSNPRPRRWSEGAQAEYEEERPGRYLQDEYAIKEVGAYVTDRHPLLDELGECGLNPRDLMFHEAEILRLAMEDLMMTQGIPVLPMHDAIIAPRSALKKAQGALERAFATHIEDVTGYPSLVGPKVTLKGDPS